MGKRTGIGCGALSRPPGCSTERSPTSQMRRPVSHTLKVIGGGLVLLGLFLLAGRLIGPSGSPAGIAVAARWFVPVWLIASGVNLWVGVAKAGYSFAEEAPIFLLVFAVPAAVAVFVIWILTRG